MSYILYRFALFLHIFLPLFIGSILYILFRSETLLVFSWIDTMGLMNHIIGYREQTKAIGSILSAPILYSLPDGCWVWSITATYIGLWKMEYSLESIGWIHLGFILGIFGEFGQFIGFVPGVFDLWDIVMMMLGLLLPKYHIQQLQKRLPAGNRLMTVSP